MSSSPSPSKTDSAGFKAKLDEAAHHAQSRSSQNNESRSSENQTPGLVEKVAQYIPEHISSKVLRRDSPDKQQQEPKNPSPPPHVPPKRPDHDEHIEEFIRDQHRSAELVLEE